METKTNKQSSKIPDGGMTIIVKTIIRMIIGFSLTDTGVHMVMVSIGYVTGRTAPIVDDTATLRMKS